ncbi:recombination protein NinB [Profundibacterium mesophilum]|uniref:Phage protein n=1 Tax=Profundibacterium mesophilum KAUST100406-0324 TaxID=1037889 RepID=A0A921NP61_9RHOB|nr:recombination protein NinB [Profundibacterium mesophilum]KAF0675097.1 putative phage protein [Profundibacterium mesophilum KAUST100406-0324]
MAQTVILRGSEQRALAKSLIDVAPADAVLRIAEATRNSDQNARLWAMLSDVSRAKPEGRRWVPETWKCAFMQSLGHECQFAEGLDGSGPFPVGFRSSRLTVRQMADLITVVAEYGDRHGVRWSEPMRELA